MGYHILMLSLYMGKTISMKMVKWLLVWEFLYVTFRKSDQNIFESRHEISNNVVCDTSKGSDLPAHTRRLVKAFASILNIL